MSRTLAALLLAFLAVKGALASTTDTPTTEALATEASSTEAGSTESPSTGAGSTESPSKGAGSTEEPSTESGSTEAPLTSAGATESPSTSAGSTQAPSTEAGSTEAPSTGAGSTQSPSTKAGSTEAPSTGAGSTESPSAGAGSTEAPSTGAGSTESPSTGTGAGSTGSTSVGLGSTESPSVGVGSTEAPSTGGSTEAPSKGAGSTETPSTEAGSTQSPTPAPTTAAPTPAGPTTTTLIANPGRVVTNLVSAVEAGDSVLDVVSTANFLVGDKIVIDKGLPEEEACVISSISSITTRLPLQNKHKVGATITVKATCQNFAAYYSCPAGTSIHGSANLIGCADKVGGVCQQQDEDQCCVSPTAMCQKGIVFDGMNTDYCCEPGCGKCGGLGCENRPGGRKKCCEELSPKCNTTTDDTCWFDKAAVAISTTAAAPVTAAPVTAPLPATIAPAPVQDLSSPCETAPPNPMVQAASRLFEGKDARQASHAFTLGNAGLLVMGFAFIAALSVGVRAVRQRRSSTRALVLAELEVGHVVEAEVDDQEAPLMG